MIDVSRLFIPGVTDQVALLCISRARHYSQFVKMVQTELKPDKKCPFCPPLDGVYNVPIEDVENPYWYAWPNKSPEENTRHHFIIAPKRHVSDTSELTAEEQLGLFNILNALKIKFCLISRGILIRDGDARLGAGTIEHLHIHLMTPDGKGRVESPFWKGTAADEESLARAVVFAKIYSGIERGALSADEQTLVRDCME